MISGVNGRKNGFNAHDQNLAFMLLKLQPPTRNFDPF